MPATDLKVGDPLIMEWSAIDNRHGKREPIHGTVAKAARIWCVFEPDDPEHRSWREFKFRRDTMNSGDRNYSQMNHRFYTPEQYEKLQVERACQQILRDAWISIEVKSPYFRDTEFTMALGNFVKKWQSEHPKH